MKKFIQVKIGSATSNEYNGVVFINLDYVKEISFITIGAKESIEIWVEGQEEVREVDLTLNPELPSILKTWLDENRCCS